MICFRALRREEFSGHGRIGPVATMTTERTKVAKTHKYSNCRISTGLESAGRFDAVTDAAATTTAESALRCLLQFGCDEGKRLDLRTVIKMHRSSPR